MRLRPFRYLAQMKRIRQVVNVFARHGFGFLVDNVTPGLFKKTSLQKKELRGAVAAHQLREALEELGPTYVKLGQLLSTRPDLLSKDFIHEMEKLQNEVPPISFQDVLAVCREEGIAVEDFSYFSEMPIAAASIAQVHQVVLKNGQRLVLKIQRPGIQKQIETDLEILLELSQLIERRTEWGALYRISDIIEELAYAISEEVDFKKEGRNTDIFGQYFKDNEHIVIPEVIWAYSSERVLALEYVEGVKISDPNAVKAAGYVPERIAKHLIDGLFKQVFEFGIFHADPHPGNIAVLADEKIVFYDFGQVGTIDRSTREKAMDLIVGMMNYDENMVSRALLEIGIASQPINQSIFRRDISRLQQKYYSIPLSQINMGETLAEIIELSFKHHIRIPSELSLLAKMLMTVESIVVQLDTKLSLIDIAKPYGEKTIRKRFSPRHVKENLSNLVHGYASLISSLPDDVNHLLRMVEAGEIKVQMEHANLNRVVNKIDILSNRVAISIILASIIMGTSFIIRESESNFVRQLPIVETGFVVAVILGLGLIYSIFKSGKY